jgi:DNA-binding transcriptional regulator YiaG
MRVMEKKKRHPWGKKLRSLRAAKVPRLTQRCLAEALDLPLTTLRNWEQGRAAPPGYVRRLVEAFILAFQG